MNLAAGYAGTADLLVEHPVHGLALVDLKTQGVKPSAKPVPYKSWCYQLAAYRRALGKPVACVNVIINSRQPAEPVEHRWSDAEIEDGWRAFDAARTLWCIEKTFNPAALSVSASEVQSFGE